MRLRVAIIGCGAIGAVLAQAIDEGRAGKVELAWLHDFEPEKSEALAKKLSLKPRIARSAAEIYSDKTVGLVIEASSQLAVEQYSLDILRSGKDIMVMSVGAFADEELLRTVRNAAEQSGRRVYIPSGAVLGIDGVKAAELGGIKKVTLTTRKPSTTLAYSVYLEKRGINLKRLKKPRVVFEGSAREAVKAFPRSVNVAATLSLAGIGLDKTKVRIVADPKLNRNIHEIRVLGKAGELVTEARNVSFSDSPKTSYLAALSAIQTLRNLSESIRVGT